MNYMHLPVATTAPLTATCSVCFEDASDYLICFGTHTHICTDCYERHLEIELDAALSNQRPTPPVEQRPHSGLHIRCFNAECENQTMCLVALPHTVARYVRDPQIFERYMAVLRTLARREDQTSVNLQDISHVTAVPRLLAKHHWFNTTPPGCEFSGLEVCLPRLSWTDGKSLVEEAEDETLFEEEEEETKQQETKQQETKHQEDEETTNEDNNHHHRCSVRSCSRKIRTWKWWMHHCRSCGRAVCQSCASSTVYDGLDVESSSHGKRRQKRVCCECLETFICRLGEGGNSVAWSEKHLLRWETKFLIPHALRHVNKIHEKVLSRLKSREHRVQKHVTKMTLLRQRLAAETRTAVRTSSSDQEDRTIRARLEDELEMSRGCLASVLQQSTEDNDRDVELFQIQARSRPRSNRSRPPSLIVRKSLLRDARIDAKQVEQWTLHTNSLVERWEEFRNRILKQANLVVENARRTFDFTLLAQARREANAKVQQIADDEEMVRSTFEGGRACPRCEWWVHRTEGCDHITCQCGHNFCYQCGMESKRSTCCFPLSHARA
jgi:hypothetical protein